MTAHERHNALVQPLLKQIIKGTADEAEALVLIESILLGLLLFYRPDVRQAVVVLEEVTAAVIARMPTP